MFTPKSRHLEGDSYDHRSSYERQRLGRRLIQVEDSKSESAQITIVTEYGHHFIALSH
jgi:hypothetical protein